jgi:16S rRNA (uracil1498-N3)-methyltransferase
MRAKRFYVPPHQIREGIATLSSDQARHLRDVLRLCTGDPVELIDGEGAGYEGIVDIAGREVRIGSLRRLRASAEACHHIVLAAAVIKQSRFDWMLEKGTELGVAEFIPLRTRFTNIRLPESKVPSRLHRWSRIVREASKQCGRFTIPKILEPRGFDELLTSQTHLDYLKMMLYERAGAPWSPSAKGAQSILLCVGPEGGWDPSEVETARGAGFQIVSLGPRILRVETAALAAVALLQYSEGAKT